MSSHPEAGKWEMPGGHIEENESPQQAAIREWEEEVGLELPPGEIVGKWDSSNGRYVGFVYEIEHEADLDLHERDRSANPDGDHFEAVAWVDPLHLHNHNLRHELMDDLGRVQGVLVKNSEEEHQGIHHPPAIDLPKYRVSHTSMIPRDSEYLESLGIHPHHLLYYSGVPHHLDVRSHYIGRYGDRVISNVDSPYYSMERHIDLRRRTVHNEGFETTHTGTGLDSEIFSNQVARLSRHGFHTIKTYAARGMGYNGHYTWPRLGYDAKFEPSEKERLPEQWQHIDTIQQLYHTPEGREWWKHNGWSKYMEFDLRPNNSLSHQVHKAYMEERAKRKPTENSLISVEDIRRHKEPKIERIDLAPWEKEALDRAWEKLDNSRSITNARKKSLPKHKVTESTIHPETTSILKKVGIESHHHLLHVLGAPTELEISRHEVTPKKFGGYTFVNTIVRGPHYGMERDIDPYNKDVYNRRFIVRHQGAGIGTKVFAAQVHHLTNLGFNNIHAVAARNDAKGEIGYKVWPKMGYNGEFSAKEKKILPKQYRHADSILHLYSMPGGRDWWEKNGWERRMSFDLSPGSESHKTFQEYLQRKQQK